MKKILLAVACVAGLGMATAADAEGAASRADAALKAKLIDMETKAWVAWKARDGKYYDRFLSEDHMDIHSGGPVGKKDVVDFVGSPVCVVASYKLGDMQYTRISPDTAALVYRVAQDSKCNDAVVPSPTWITSIYVKRGKRWLNFLFESAPART